MANPILEHPTRQATLPAMIRDLLTTGDPESRARNAAWLHSLVDLYATGKRVA